MKKKVPKKYLKFVLKWLAQDAMNASLAHTIPEGYDIQKVVAAKREVRERIWRMVERVK